MWYNFIVSTIRVTEASREKLQMEVWKVRGKKCVQFFIILKLNEKVLGYFKE